MPREGSVIYIVSVARNDEDLLHDSAWSNKHFAEARALQIDDEWPGGASHLVCMEVDPPPSELPGGAANPW